MAENFGNTGEELKTALAKFTRILCTRDISKGSIEAFFPAALSLLTRILEFDQSVLEKYCEGSLENQLSVSLSLIYSRVEDLYSYALDNLHAARLLYMQ